ncbi:radical SAM family heme chaperone HemW [Winogradskyella aurantiaca]|uniref:radical SAM family heme chaperone HemW n=1 Tax=Winogradskyella aurantiaca TaxID=2219558 RepID=UPI000E1C42BF|nr:radical SAM family heme chaperone HemW [Winogradskyella aurantiaca]
MAGIYIHIPFCKQACHYCDFHFSTSLKKKEAMLIALKKELELRAMELKDETIETIYFGGGTPSILETEEIESLIDLVYENFEVRSTPEITVEANPDDLSSEVLKALASSKVNRLSIGIQSFFENDLKLMNRAHNALEAKECIEESKRFFNNISIDLIYGIPGASNEQWQENIQIALDYEVPHISCYALTVEPKTALESFIKKGLVEPVNDDGAHEQFLLLKDILEERGFVHYELSNFGMEGYFSKNNTAYWQGKSYLGIGPSAHSFNGQQRSWNVRNNSKYIKALEQDQLPSEIETLTKVDRYNEYVMTRLRTKWGISLNYIKKEFGELYLQYLMDQAHSFIEGHLLFHDKDQLYVSKKGLFLSDGIASQLFKLNL